ncbi:unnamed protein product [Leptidea sinapis]|uniref:Uncharacterized protein n=1 Tax=Leptidea sinapis TaxID=189913 RepID=A0A5E4QD80_9NEOP|nr:unnamed protein product [Leptidea sinapis]
MCVGAVLVAILAPFTENFDVLPTNVAYPFVDINSPSTYVILYVHHVYYKPATCIIDGIEILSFNLRQFDKLADRKCKRSTVNRSYSYYTKDRQFYINAVLKKA